MVLFDAHLDGRSLRRAGLASVVLSEAQVVARREADRHPTIGENEIVHVL